MAGISYKDSVSAATKEIDDVLGMLSEDQLDAPKMREKLTTLLDKINPAVNECTNDNCSIDTWKGPDNICPLCQERGARKGRLVK